jgi:NADH dehydrogenase
VCRVLILGGGFGGTYAALEFERIVAHRNDVEITLVTRDNYFLFTPMLHEVAASDLEINAIISPLRKLLRRVKTFTGHVENIRLDDRTVTVAHGFDDHLHELCYEHLILALGSGTNFHSVPMLEKSALTIRTLDDAIELRNRLIRHLEDANSECAADQRQPLLTFVVAGAGFAGVETVGAINDFVREAIRFYPNLKADFIRTVLISSEQFILPELGRKLGAYAQRKLSARGVEIVAKTRVSAVRDGLVELSNGQKIAATTLVWAGGNAPHRLISDLSIPKRDGRIGVDEYLNVPGFPGVWALGDCASIPDGMAGFHPPTAQHAIREGRCAARNVAAEILGGGKKPLRFTTVGRLAVIGNRTGVANIFGLNFSGFIAWWLWRTIYLFKLPRLEKRVRVAIDWTLDLCFAKDFACVMAGSASPTRDGEKTGATLSLPQRKDRRDPIASPDGGEPKAQSRRTPAIVALSTGG